MMPGVIVPRSSSPTSPLDGDGVLIQNGNATGPIQLPIESADRFVEEFNTTYAVKQIRLEIRRTDPTD